MQSNDYLNSTASNCPAWFRNTLKENKQAIISVTTVGLLVILAWKYLHKRMSNNGEKDEPESHDKTSSEESTSKNKESISEIPKESTSSMKEEEITTSKNKESISEIPEESTSSMKEEEITTSKNKESISEIPEESTSSMKEEEITTSENKESISEIPEESTSSMKEEEITTSKRKESIPENGDSRENSESEENVNDDQVFLIGKEEKKIKVVIRRGDITSEEVNVIVNAANGRLMHGGGVARAIAVKAGRGIDDEGQKKLRERGSALRVSEVLDTDAYNLNAEHVLHAVGPIRGRDRDFHSLLKDTFMNCLEYADEQLKAKSIAIPLISSGIFGGQKKECADALIQAVNKFAENETINNIEEIRLVNIDAEATDAINKASFSKFKPGQSSS